MKFRAVAATVFVFGALLFSMALLVNWSQGRVATDPELVAATTVVNDENFGDVVLASQKPVVLDFYGDYCVVCRQLDPKLLTLAKEYSETALFARINVQEAPKLIEQYRVRAVPTLVVVQQGEVLFQGEGLAALPPIQDFLGQSALTKVSLRENRTR